MQEVGDVGHVVSRVYTKRTILLHPEKVILGQIVYVYLVLGVLWVLQICLAPAWKSYEDLVFVLRQNENPASCQWSAEADRMTDLLSLPALLVRVMRLFLLLCKPRGHLCALLNPDRCIAIYSQARLHLNQTVALATSAT